MIIFENGQRFQIAGTVMSDGGTTIIPLSAVSILSRPASFAGSTEGIIPPIIYVELNIIDIGAVMTAMSVAEHNIITIAETNRQPIAPPNVFKSAAQTVARKFSCCGSK